ncbi:MAG: hypothetical protein ACRC9L_02370 [Brevinema sp.]
MGLFDDLPGNSFLKKLLTGEEPDFVERFLTVKQKFERATDKEDKRTFRDQLTGLFWDLYQRVGLQIGPHIAPAKRLFLRFGIIDMRYLSPEDQQRILAVSTQAPDYNSETVYYADEWLQGVREGRIKPSSGDETEKKGPAPVQNMGGINPKREKFSSLIQVERDRYQRFVDEKNHELRRLHEIVQNLEIVHTNTELDISGLITAEQMKFLDEISDIQKSIRRIQKEMTATIRIIEKAHNQLRELDASEQGNMMPGGYGGYGGNDELVRDEISSIRQMHKMTVGRQGNMFPILNSSIIPKEAKSPLYKDFVKERLEYWLDLDPEAFNRVYRGDTMSITPYIVLVPGYGTIGICWEPLDKDNKQFGRGRCALPIFSRSPDVTLLSSIGDLRWQSAKEIASYYWMEEGLTGRYYEYYLSAKLKGDLRLLFITDYLLWMTKETQGVQKLEKDARYVFWRFVPLPDEKKVWLSQKGYYYAQLWQNEQTWRKGQEK